MRIGQPFLLSLILWGGLLLTASARAEVPLRRMLDGIVDGQYRTDVEILAGQSTFKAGRREYRMTDRFTPQNLQIARTYLLKRLREIGFDEVSSQEFPMLYKTGSGLEKRGDGVNLWVELRGSQKPSEIVTYVAHYDTTGKRRPGANDNGTGVSSLLAVADAFKKSGVRPKRTIRFLLTDGEERRPLYQGSEHYFEQSIQRGETNVLVINVDMLGHQPSEHNTAGYSADFFPAAKSLLEAANKRSGLNMEMTAFEPFYSDNLPPTFKGIPALAITEDARDKNGALIENYPHYHQRTDKPGKVNFPYAMKLVRWSAATLFMAAKNTNERYESDRSLLLQYSDTLARKYRDEGRHHEARELRRYGRGLCMETLQILGDPDL